MLRSLFAVILVFYTGFLQGQNVGIGIANPADALHVYSATNGSPLRVETVFSGNAEIEFRSQNDLGGYVGLFNNRMEFMSIDNRNLVLGTDGINRVYVNTAGNVGIGVELANERLVIASGNIQLQSSEKGIILNAADRPLITRGFDAFSSGANAGIGRWGLFMEPNRLVLGMPTGSDARAVEIAGYLSNGNRITRLTIHENGTVRRPSTNNVDLLPIAMGSIDNFAVVLGGSGNFSVTSNNNGMREITLTGRSYNNENYLTLVTCIQEGVTAYAMTQAEGGKLRVITYNQGGTLSNRSFHFVVYKLF
jgi:hypothetical protein